MKSVLVSFYNRGTEEQPFWEVYLHQARGINKNVGTFQFEQAAMRKAHEYGLPVIRGQGERVEHLLEILEVQHQAH